LLGLELLVLVAEAGTTETSASTQASTEPTAATRTLENRRIWTSISAPRGRPVTLLIPTRLRSQAHRRRWPTSIHADGGNVNGGGGRLTIW